MFSTQTFFFLNTSFFSFLLNRDVLCLLIPGNYLSSPSLPFPPDPFLHCDMDEGFEGLLSCI